MVDSESTNTPNQESQHTTNKKQRKAYEGTGLNIQPYRKKPKRKTAHFLSDDDPHRKQYEEKSVSKNSWKLDMLWLLGFDVTPKKLTSLWHGWKAKILEALQYTQKIWYLPQINLSPTNHSVVAETM